LGEHKSSRRLILTPQRAEIPGTPRGVIGLFAKDIYGNEVEKVSYLTSTTGILRPNPTITSVLDLTAVNLKVLPVRLSLQVLVLQVLPVLSVSS
jgi:hypothetical protein